MKRITVLIDHDDMEEIIRDYLETMFPGMEMDPIMSLSYSDVTVRLCKPLNPIEPAPKFEPEEQPEPAPMLGEVQF